MKHKGDVMRGPRGELPPGVSDANERWVDCPGWESLYEVSDLGRVRKKSTGMMLRYRPDEKYYVEQWKERHGNSRSGMGGAVVRLFDGNRYRRLSVARLVLEAFVGPPPKDSPRARRLHPDPMDNRLANLYWGSQTKKLVMEPGISEPKIRRIWRDLLKSIRNE